MKQYLVKAKCDISDNFNICVVELSNSNRNCRYVYIYISVSISGYVHRFAGRAVDCAMTTVPMLGSKLSWPLHEIAITDIVWYVAHAGEVGGGAYIAQWPCNSIAIG